MERSDEDSSQNYTEKCMTEPEYLAVMTSLNVVSLVLGQPLAARMLLFTLRSKQLDILNCNLALFHLVQNLFFYAQLFIVFFRPHLQSTYYQFVFVYIQVGGPMQLCFICLERFIAVIHPTYFPLLKTYRCREACVAVVWTLSLTLAILFVFDDTANISEVVAQVLPLGLMVTLSLIIVFTSVTVAKVLRNPSVGKESIHPVKKRAFRTIAITSAVALCCYVPVMIMLKYKDTEKDESLYKCKMVPLCIFFLSTASLVHPLFYMHAKGELSCRRCTKTSG